MFEYKITNIRSGMTVFLFTDPFDPSRKILNKKPPEVMEGLEFMCLERGR